MKRQAFSRSSRGRESIKTQERESRRFRKGEDKVLKGQLLCELAWFLCLQGPRSRMSYQRWLGKLDISAWPGLALLRWGKRNKNLGKGTLHIPTSDICISECFLQEWKRNRIWKQHSHELMPSHWKVTLSLRAEHKERLMISGDSWALEINQL